MLFNHLRNDALNWIGAKNKSPEANPARRTNETMSLMFIIQMKSKKANSQYLVAELFCGCGGFSHGFWRTGRFQAMLGNDIKKYTLTTFKLNHSHGKNKCSTLAAIIPSLHSLVG